MNLVYKKHTTLSSLLKKLAREAPREWFRQMQGFDSNNPKVAEVVRVFYSHNFRRVFLMLLNGAENSSGSCVVLMDISLPKDSNISWV